METHNLPEAAKVQRFCLTLTSEARLWYETLRPTEVDWTGLQDCFRQQHFKFGNMREQLFHVWRSFHYDENTEAIDSYVSRIKQVAALLNYGEPQILELLKNALPSKLYWILFSIKNLRYTVDVPQIDRLGKMSPVLRVPTPIYAVSKQIDGKTLIFQVKLGI